MRVYSEQEVSQILERAVEQQARAHPASPEAGLTLDELERIGAEVGIEARYLRSAAAEVDASGGATTRRSRSATHLFVERWVPGTLTDEAWEDMVAELETRVGKGKQPFGKARRHEQREGRNREWVHSDSVGYETRVMASLRGDRVRLRLSQRVGMGTSATDGAIIGGLIGWLPGVLLAGVLLGDRDGDIWTLAATIASMVAVGFLTYLLDRPWRDRKHDQLDALADDLVGLMMDTAPLSPEATRDRPGAATLDKPLVQKAALLEDMPDLNEADSAVVPPTRTRA